MSRTWMVAGPLHMDTVTRKNTIPPRKGFRPHFCCSPHRPAAHVNKTNLKKGASSLLQDIWHWVLASSWVMNQTLLHWFYVGKKLYMKLFFRKIQWGEFFLKLWPMFGPFWCQLSNVVARFWLTLSGYGLAVFSRGGQPNSDRRYPGTGWRF